MENLVYVMLRGFAIGVLISAPMGPIGMLVIQRTLNKGRREAFFTGIGAAISDLAYCLLTGFGIAFVSAFIEKQQLLLQLVGSIVIAAFGVYLFRSNPTRRLRAARPGDDAAARTSWSDLVTGFLFTVSNPFIIFFIIGLFARFNFFLPEFRFYHYIAGYVAIAAGALSWWFVITTLVNKMRAHFNVRSLYLINRVIGSILLLFAVVGCLSSIIDYIA